MATSKQNFNRTLSKLRKMFPGSVIKLRVDSYLQPYDVEPGIWWAVSVDGRMIEGLPSGDAVITAVTA